jgi:hypothetical protein
MWWWQSQASVGALSFGASAPDELGTAPLSCAPLRPGLSAPVASAATPALAKKVRRPIT